MRVQVKLYSILRLRHKDYDSEKGLEIKLEKELTIVDLLHVLKIAHSEVHMILVNGKHLKEIDCFLNNDDIIEIFPHFPSGG